MIDPKKAGDTPCDCAPTGYVCDDHHGRLNESKPTPASSDVVETRGSPAEMAERLRGWADHVNPVHLLREAADMIERLERERDTQRTLFEEAARQVNEAIAETVVAAKRAEADLRYARESWSLVDAKLSKTEAERDAAIEHVKALLDYFADPDAPSESDLRDPDFWEGSYTNAPSEDYKAYWRVVDGARAFLNGRDSGGRDGS